MECNKDEAVRAKGIAEDKMLNNDFEGARRIALKARNLYPELDNISQLISVCDIHCSAQKKINGAEKDLYGILQVENIADEATIKKQYRKFALVLHPDKNKFPGAEAAFKLIGEANMILSDKGKRSVYDMKCRESARASVTKLQRRQGSQSSYASTQSAQNKPNNVSSSHFNGNNYRQQSTSNSGSRLSFWTYCPFCNIKYEYYREFLNRPLRCQHCSKLFLAYDIGAQAATPNTGFVHRQKTTPHVSQQEPGKWEKVKVNMQNNGQFPSHFAHQTSAGVQFAQHKAGSSRTNKESGKDGVRSPKVNVRKPMETGNSKDTKKKRGKKVEAECSKSSSDVKDACGGSGASPVGDGPSAKRSRQRQKDSYNEDAGGELSPQKRSKLSKSSSDAKTEEDSSKADKDACEQKASLNANVSIPNGNHTKKHKVKTEDVSSDSEPELLDCLEPEFSNFDKGKEEDCFAADQIWACYDSVDGMPRFYARVRKTFSSGFRLKITWLEADPENEAGIKWADEDLPFSCGRFVHGETEMTRDRLMFSHQMTVEKRGAKSVSYVIRPRTGEIWALFKNWDIKWSLEPENHREYKFDIVEILSTHDNGISVAFLLKVKGFVSVFQRTNREETITSNELLRFSHRIPSAKLSGTEKAGVPSGSFELDPAALPGALEAYHYSEEVKLEAEKVSECEEQVKMTPKKHVNLEAKNGFDNGALSPRRSPRGLKNGSDQFNGVKTQGN